MLPDTTTLQIRSRTGEKTFIRVFANEHARKMALRIAGGEEYPALPIIKNVRTVLDIGANVGVSALWFSYLYPRSRIVAAEPSPDAFELLKHNTAQKPKIEIYNVGLFSATQKASLYRGFSNCSTNSIGLSEANDSAAFDVDLVAADEFIRAKEIGPIDVVKIDTEGCERPILESIEERVAEMKAIYLEYHSEADRRWIDQFLSRTHVLEGGRVITRHRGVFWYVARSAFESAAEADRFEIRLPKQSRGTPAAQQLYD